MQGGPPQPKGGGQNGRARRQDGRYVFKARQLALRDYLVAVPTSLPSMVNPKRSNPHANHVEAARPTALLSYLDVHVRIIAPLMTSERPHGRRRPIEGPTLAPSAFA
jgi:hypothetical protein